jgi:hypothetical protein
LARNDAGFSNEGLAAGVPALDAALFEVALFEAGAGAWASKVEQRAKLEHKTVLANSDFM